MTEFFEEAAVPITKPQRRNRRNRKFRRILRTGIILMIVAAIVVLIGTLTFSYVKSLTAKPEIADYTDHPGAPTLVVIAEGDLGTDIAAELKEKKVVASTAAFIQAFDANPRAASIQPGTYYVRTHISAKEAIATLLDPASKAEYTVTIPEGMRATDIYAKLADVYQLSTDDVQKQAADALAQIGLPAEAGGNIEGWLAPGQYNFMPDTTISQALSQMVQRRVKELSDSDIPRTQWQRQLIIASIVEKEVRRTEDYPKAARAIENRLAKDMLLQVDSSVMYALNKFEIMPSAQDLSTDTPYNTYLHKGLPPGPICNPSVQVLQATVNPPAGEWLFWVTVNPSTGETKFAATNEEHEKYAEQFRQWCKDNDC